MSDEHQLIRERERGAKAQQILGNEIFQDVWSAMDANLTAAMTSPSATDEAVLEARRGLIILRRVKAEVERVLKTGEMANIQLTKEV